MKSPQPAFIALLFLLLLPASFAHAGQLYAEDYAVGSNGSTVAQPDFTINQEPYIYIQFYNPPSASVLDEITSSAWTSPGGITYDPSVSSSGNQVWVTFPTTGPTGWNSIKTPGTWDTLEMSSGSSSFSERASFTVNAAPEPPGTVLFLIGALIMGISILRRKKIITI